MSGFKEPGFADRQKAAQEASKNLLDKFRRSPDPMIPRWRKSRAEREALAATRAKAREARDAEKAEQKRAEEAAAAEAARIAREEEEAARQAGMRPSRRQSATPATPPERASGRERDLQRRMTLKPRPFK